MTGARPDRVSHAPGMAIAAAAALMLLAVGENTIAPWAPFYVVYIALATLLPLWLGCGPILPARRTGALTWAAVILGPVLLQALTGLWLAAIHPALLGLAGVPPEGAAGAFHSFPVALESMFAAAGARWGRDPAAIQMIYLILVVAWAGFGEEIFYRGWLHAALRPKGAAVATIVSALFFAVRHAAQLALVEPYPWGAAASWCAIAFVMGLFMSWLYERTGSLFAPIAAHYIFNLIPLAALLAG